MSTNPARTFGPALNASYWHALWIYFLAPPLGMLGAAEIFLLARGGQGPYCAKLHHRNDKRCIFATPNRTPRRLQQKQRAMREENITADRLIAFSDAVFAAIVTVMVLELKGARAILLALVRNSCPLVGGHVEVTAEGGHKQ
jgi:hypothetical protein